jgi:hypothetical protein
MPQAFDFFERCEPRALRERRWKSSGWTFSAACRLGKL